MPTPRRLVLKVGAISFCWLEMLGLSAKEVLPVPVQPTKATLSRSTEDMAKVAKTSSSTWSLSHKMLKEHGNHAAVLCFEVPTML